MRLLRVLSRKAADCSFRRVVRRVSGSGDAFSHRRNLHDASAPLLVDNLQRVSRTFTIPESAVSTSFLRKHLFKRPAGSISSVVGYNIQLSEPLERRSLDRLIFVCRIQLYRARTVGESVDQRSKLTTAASSCNHPTPSFHAASALGIPSLDHFQ